MKTEEEIIKMLENTQKALSHYTAENVCGYYNGQISALNWVLEKDGDIEK